MWCALMSSKLVVWALFSCSSTTCRSVVVSLPQYTSGALLLKFTSRLNRLWVPCSKLRNFIYIQCIQQLWCRTGVYNHGLRSPCSLHLFRLVTAAARQAGQEPVDRLHQWGGTLLSPQHTRNNICPVHFDVSVSHLCCVWFLLASRSSPSAVHQLCAYKGAGR